MKKDEIIDFLLEREISEVEEIPYKNDILVLRAYYDLNANLKKRTVSGMMISYFLILVM